VTKRVLLTGGAGFVGSHVARQLLSSGYEVALFLRPTSDLRRLDSCLSKCSVIYGDLASLSESAAVINEFRPTSVIHLAWAGVKGKDRNDHIQLSNVVGSINLFELAKTIGCKQFVGLGSQAEYGILSGRINEQAKTSPTTLYGATKLATGQILERAAADSDINFSWLRLFSSYGPGDDPSWLLPYLVQSFLAGEVPRLTKAEQIWDYIFIDDVASAIVAACNSSAQGLFNLGSGQGNKLRLIVETVRNIIDPSLNIDFGAVPYRGDQVMHLEADISALVKATDWSPKVSLQEGLQKLILSYQIN
jgi:UDP-glucose 4-epimerase